MAHRLTKHNEDGSVQLWDTTPEQAIERLAAYEDMHDEIEEQLSVVEEKLEELQDDESSENFDSSDGATNSANSVNPEVSQLLAEQVALKTTMGMFEIFGIRE